MNERSGVFLLQEGSTLVAMEPASFATEDAFQQLLSQFPELLVGDQIDPQSPRRWVLVKREQQVRTGAPGAAAWSIDHVFLDQDGIPTLVEIKRQSDSRIRREVVGQMLDYAANCATWWSAESLRQAFDQTCSASGKNAEQVLEALLGQDLSPQDFWARVQKNLQTGTLRLLFVADSIPLELRRVVEFLNLQMVRAEVLAVELRQFEKGSLRTIVPTIYGHTQEATAQKQAATGRVWNADLLFADLESNVDENGVDAARAIFEWMIKGGKRPVVFGTGQGSGSVYPVFKPDGIRINPVYLSSSGRLYVQFGALNNKPVFGDLSRRRELMNRFNQINGLNLTDRDLNRYPAIPLQTITADPAGLSKAIAALTWMEAEIDAASGPK